jgi:hypothetical protein
MHLIRTLAKIIGLGGVRGVAAESLLLKHQLLINSRSRKRAPTLTTLDRFVLGLFSLFVRPHRIPKLSAILKPATLFKFHKALVDRKYRRLFSSSSVRRKSGLKGLSSELIAAIVEMKHRNPKFGCVRCCQKTRTARSVVPPERKVGILSRYGRFPISATVLDHCRGCVVKAPAAGSH